MTIITQRATKLSKDFLKVAREAGLQVSEKTGKVAAKASKSLDELILSNATSRNVVTYHPGAAASFDALMGAVKGAKKSFHIETFIWHDDESGKALADALIKKVADAKAAGTTFDAKVLIDSIGINSGYGTHDANILKTLTDGGVDARLFNPNKVSLSATGHMPLTHRKLYIADGEQYLTGGRNIGNEYLQPKFERTFGKAATSAVSHEDLLITVRGEEAAKVQGEFYKNWSKVGGTVPAIAPKVVPAVEGHTLVGTFVTDPINHEFGIKDAHLKAIAAAKKDIFLISPYLGDDQLIDGLVSAKQKNTALRASLLSRANNKYERAAVDEAVPELKVRVLVPMAGEKGKDLNYQADMMSAKQLVNAGIEVRATQGGVLNGAPAERFSHLKGMEIDGELLSVGSANADFRTYNTNHELVNIIGDKQKVAEFTQSVAEPDWAGATPITSDWLKKNTSVAERVFRAIFEPLDFLY